MVIANFIFVHTLDQQKRRVEERNREYNEFLRNKEAHGRQPRVGLKKYMKRSSVDGSAPISLFCPQARKISCFLPE